MENSSRQVVPGIGFLTVFSTNFVRCWCLDNHIRFHLCGKHNVSPAVKHYYAYYFLGTACKRWCYARLLKCTVDVTHHKKHSLSPSCTRRKKSVVSVSTLLKSVLSICVYTAPLAYMTSCSGTGIWMSRFYRILIFCEVRKTKNK